MNGIWLYCTSKNSGPSWTHDPVTMLYLGTSVAKAEQAVGDFAKYQKEEKDFPSHHIELYNALPNDHPFELIQWYMADGWWYSIVRFFLEIKDEG